MQHSTFRAALNPCVRSTDGAEAVRGGRSNDALLQAAYSQRWPSPAPDTGLQASAITSASGRPAAQPPLPADSLVWGTANRAATPADPPSATLSQTYDHTSRHCAQTRQLDASRAGMSCCTTIRSRGISVCGSSPETQTLESTRINRLVFKPVARSVAATALRDWMTNRRPSRVT